MNDDDNDDDDKLNLFKKIYRHVINWFYSTNTTLKSKNDLYTMMIGVSANNIQ
jgi:hypothetical protein